MLTSDSKKINLLLFEQSSAEVERITKHLEQSGLDFTITPSMRLDEGLRQLATRQFDAILVNLNLPDSRGIETLHALMNRHQNEAIIVISEADDEELSTEALSIGAQDYLIQSRLNSDTLKRTIRHAMARTNSLNSVKQDETQFQQEETLLHQIFDVHSDGMLILTPEYKIKFLNTAAGMLLETDPDQLVGEVFPFKFNDNIISELEIPNSTGTTRIVKLWVADLIWGGRRVLFVTLRDITQRRHAELGLMRERKCLSATLDSILDAVIVTDKSGAVERINNGAIQLADISSEDAIGQPLEKVLKLKHPKTGISISNITSALMDPDFLKISTQLGLTLARPNKEKIKVSVKSYGILDNYDKHWGCITVFRDITLQKKTEAELFEAESLHSISLLAGGIAHDFNNMLTTILGNISVMQHELDKDHQHFVKLEAAENAALQARSLSQQLLTFSKGGVPIVELTTVSEIVEESAQFILHGSNVKCSVKSDDDLWVIEADKGQIQQVVNNLIINADQAMPTGGMISIRIYNQQVQQNQIKELQAGQYVCIEVNDTGSGIAPENLKNIFEPYFTTKREGNGLGLASSYSIIQSHKGIITAESELGRGSTFRIYLPKSDNPNANKLKPIIENEEDSSSDVIHHGKGRILVMDDMEAMRMVAGEILAVLGYEAEFATTGTEAIAAYKEAKESGRPFDACVFDLTVPGDMGGEDAANLLVKYDSNLVAIASSGYSTSNIMNDYKQTAFKAVVPKPYRIKEMGAVLHYALNPRMNP